MNISPRPAPAKQLEKLIAWPLRSMRSVTIRSFPMNVFESPSFDRHENVVFAHDPATGLRAIIAVHSLSLGPAAGGCRMWPYASSAEALEDVLRLSKGMSYKNAMASLPMGGGKAVIIGDPMADKTEALFEAYGTRVNALGGQYITAEDVGTTVK